MQWFPQSPAMNHCHDMQMMQKAHDQSIQHCCHMNSDCQKMCNSFQHCSNVTVSILSDFNLTFNAVSNPQLYSPDQALQFNPLIDGLFRPPRA